jgi:hypothetical protein
VVFLRHSLFALLTWGIILGLPILAYFALRSHYPRIGWFVPSLLALLLLSVGVFFGEWLARLANWLIEFVLPLKRKTKRL